MFFVEPVGVPPAPGPVGIIIGIINALLSLLGFASGVTKDPQAYQAIAGIGNYAYNSLQNAFGFLSDITDSIKRIFKSLWDTIILGTLTKLLKAFLQLRAFLQRIFAPIIKYLKLLRQIYDSYFNKFVRPLLKTIRQIRQFLQIFRLLGFKWAKRLDARLAGIENKIVQAYEVIRQNLNRVISWVDLIADPTFLLRRNPLFGALIRSSAELRNLMLQQVTRPLTPDEQATQDQARGRYTMTAYKQRQNDFYSNGQLPDDSQAALDDFRARASAYLSS